MVLITRRRACALLGGGVVSLFVNTGCSSGGGLATPQGSGATGRSVVLQWNNALLQAIRDTKPGPPMVARMIAITHTCMYDAWAAYDSAAVGTRLGGQLRRPASEATPANKQRAVSYAAYRALVDLFPQPAEVAMFNSLMSMLGYDPTDTSADTTTATGIGNAASKAVLDFRHSDGSNQLGDLHPGAYSDYTGYSPVNDPDHINDPNAWQPLRVPDGHGGFVIQKYVGAQWGRVIPFALSSGSQFRCPAPPGYPSIEYTVQAQQMLDTSAALTDQQKAIAEYFADGPSSELPPGHWSLFAQYVSQRDQYTLDQDVKLFFLVGNAVMDAGIAAWDGKRAYNSARPITAVHYLFGGKTVEAWAGPGKGTESIDGATWQPYQPLTVVTPPFPECISGHSTFSAAAAEVLKRFTGSDAFGNSVTIPAGSSKVEPGVTPASDVTLYWATFSDAADQAGISRRYGGIHFAYGDLQGRTVGRMVGAAVFQKAQGYFTGTAS